MWKLTLSSYCQSLQPDIAHPCCGQLTAVKTGYLLTSITWPYCKLRCRPIKVVGYVDKFLVSTDRRPNSNWISLLQCFSLAGALPLALAKSIEGCALRKIEGSPVLWNCKIKGAQHMICMKKLRFSSHPRAKVRCQGPLGSARAQPCYILIIVLVFISVAPLCHLLPL